MKIFGLLLVSLFVCSVAFADASFEIKSVDLDQNGNIRVWTIHRVNNQEVPSQYPMIDGHYVWATRYAKNNFKGMDKTQAQDYILNDIKNYSDVLIQKEFDKVAPKTVNQIRIDYNSAVNDTFAKENLDTLVGKGLTTTEASQKIDTDGDGVQDKELLITTSGTMSEKAITQ